MRASGEWCQPSCPRALRAAGAWRRARVRISLVELLRVSFRMATREGWCSQYLRLNINLTRYAYGFMEVCRKSEVGEISRLLAGTFDPHDFSAGNSEIIRQAAEGRLISLLRRRRTAFFSDFTPISHNFTGPHSATTTTVMSTFLAHMLLTAVHVPATVPPSRPEYLCAGMPLRTQHSSHRPSCTARRRRRYPVPHRRQDERGHHRTNKLVAGQKVLFRARLRIKCRSSVSGDMVLMLSQHKRHLA